MVFTPEKQKICVKEESRILCWAQMAEICKVLLLGAVKVGKTAFLLRYSDSQFHEAYISTVGIDYRAKEVTRYVILIFMSVSMHGQS